MAKRPLALILAAAALPLAGCAVGPDYHPKPASELGVPEAYSVPADSSREDLAEWWKKFDDPLLGQLVEQGRAANLDVGQAVARLRQARESLVQARAALLPAVTASGGVSRNQGVTGTGGFADNSSFSIGADASYQVDLFGGNRRNTEAAGAAAEAASYDVAAVLISVEAEIARNYVLARLAQAQLANARDSLGIQDDNLQIAQWRVQAGLVSSIDAETARAQRAQTAASIPSLESAYNGYVSRIGVLTGQAPGALKGQLEAVKPIPAGPSSVAAGIPADTLRQRPDVRSAERNLAAASARIGVAEAQLYPQLSIGGSLGSGGGTVGSLFDVITGRLFANIAQTIFDGGRLKSQVRSAEAAAEGSFLAYKSSVLSALEDSENAIVALKAAQDRAAQYAVALEASNNQAILARMQYRSGLTDFTTLNQAESALLSARNGLSQAKSDEATALIALYLALGGGWDLNSTPEATANGQ
ncbi:efflux transporter outer membrane subunit [Sphingomonas sp.]|uniref:efflux transporter outer membrane subunit n=1 Tax=Sphingomonas sp. TaxID=28214 RepID=UPI001B0868D0|nr:efflux transporter outer membrane subunit [Sphingomonas sp.]MBO9714036.1 efflux transporter outer membrane subunit [Sphingomonas sp.]